MEFPQVGPITAEGLTIINAQGVTVASVDTSGNAVFQSVNTPSIELDGFDLETRLNQLPQGLIALALCPTDVGPYAGTELECGEVTIPAADMNRFYRTGFACRLDVGSSQPTYVGINCRYAFGASPTPSSTLLFATQLGGRSTSETDDAYSADFTFQIPSANDGQDMYIGFFLTASVSGTSWAQGETYARCYTEDLGALGASSTYTPNQPPIQQYTKTYSTNGTHVFQGDGTNRDAYASGHVFQGQYDSTNGNQFSVVNFDYATIASDLSGATIVKTEVFLTNQHWYSNGGGTAVIGYTSPAGGSGNYTYSNAQPAINTFSGWAVGAAKWVTVNNSIGNAFKSGAAHSLVIGKGVNTTTTYYGYFAGNGQTGEPQLRITYTK